ncbi:MAG: hypothetical protein Q8N09_00815 [Thermodesulfovibrionia bacterium]|nr:hypothetical protein [Thermodesulfovibrionia bacterium]
MHNEIKLLKSEIKKLRKALSELTPSLDILLKRRGFKVYKKEPSEDLLLPGEKYINIFYEKLKKYSFRLFLRDVIKHQNFFTIDKVARYATKEVTSQYIDFLLKANLAESTAKGYRLKKRPIKSFGETLEWFIARLIEKEFEAETIWGVKFKRPKVGGDYDLIAKIDSSILYMEIKSSPPKQIYDKEITAFLSRVEDLSPEISIFFMDTELRMKDKIVPMFEAELQRRYKKSVSVERIVKELFHINKKIFIINSKDSIIANIGTALNFKWHNNEVLICKESI